MVIKRKNVGIDSMTSNRREITKSDPCAEVTCDRAEDHADNNSDPDRNETDRKRYP